MASPRGRSRERPHSEPRTGESLSCAFSLRDDRRTFGGRTSERASLSLSFSLSLCVSRTLARASVTLSYRNMPMKFLVDRERNVPPLADMTRSDRIVRLQNSSFASTSENVYGWFSSSVRLICTSPDNCRVRSLLNLR